jgi:glycosyltransferase involved in cell wall biosynthesis
LEFLLIGEGEERKEAEELIRKSANSNVKLIGYKANIDEYLLATDVYLSTSLWEGLPYTLIEAARAGLPIVASNVTGNNEVAIHDYNGFLFDLNDLDSAADRIKHLYNSKSEVRRLGDLLSYFMSYQTIYPLLNLFIVLNTIS